MVTIKHFSGICAGILVSVSLHAADPASYKIGDKAPEDIKASVAFDVVDLQATADLKASKARTIAAIYRQVTTVTNVVMQQFLGAYGKAHANFSKALVTTYHQRTIDNTTIETSDFGYFVTAFNVENKNFPVTTELAVTWARGNPDAPLRDKWLGMVMQMLKTPVQPDKLPAHFPIYGKKVRLMPVATKNETFTVEAAWHKGYVITTNIPTISSVRTQFRREFPESDQLVAQVFAQRFLQPTCFPEPGLTQDARDLSVRSIVVSAHFDADEVIVHRGAMIDANAIAALDAMDKARMPDALSQQVAVEQHAAQQEHSRAEQVQQQAQSDHVASQVALQQAQLAQEKAESAAQQESEKATAMHQQALNAQKQALDAQNLAQKIHQRYEWLLAALGVISILTLAVLWRLTRHRTAPVSAPVKLQRVEKQTAIAPAELAPYLAQTLKDAVVQGLATQRAELLEAQRFAAVEIAELVHRLDQLQVPMQERLRAYQDRIQELQKDLAERTEENRELLKMKIEMTRHQLETERNRVSVKLN